MEPLVLWMGTSDSGEAISPSGKTARMLNIRLQKPLAMT
jgi:hypothetical protein